MKTKAENGQYFQYTFDAGDIVRYSKPEAGEENFLFRVIEDNGNRVHIEDMNPAPGALPGQETVSPEELALVTVPEVRRMTAEDCAQYGVDVADYPNDTLWLAIWPDRSGYYTEDTNNPAPAGRYCATVFNDSEIFSTQADCHAWLFSKLESSQ